MATGRRVPPPAPPTERDDIDPEERAAQTRFLRERWDALAALAWESYQAEGRGAVVLNVVSTAGQGKTEVIYVSERAVRERGLQWPDPDTARMVVDYRSEREAVIAVPRENGGNSTYQMQGPIAPPEAYRRRERGRRTPPTV
ncbi:MAG: hypothetical protein ACJ8CR_17660 [Roseiflexaceae bacterium]